MFRPEGHVHTPSRERIVWSALGLVALLAACGKDVAVTPDASAPDSGSPGTQISGSITTDATWSGALELTGATTIEAGVTVTVTAGAVIAARSTSSLTVLGKLDVEGTSAAKVVMK